MKTLVFTIFIAGLLLAGCASSNQVPPPPSAPPPASSGTTSPTLAVNLPESCLDFPENATLISEPFQVVNGEGFGEATLAGTVKKRKEEVWGETHELVYFVAQEPAIEGPGARFYEYFWKMVESGNTVNIGPENNLGFGLGVLKDGKISSTASISQDTEEKILDALQNPKTIPLTFRIPKYMGRGAPANFSFACIIE